MELDTAKTIIKLEAHLLRSDFAWRQFEEALGKRGKAYFDKLLSKSISTLKAEGLLADDGQKVGKW